MTCLTQIYGCCIFVSSLGSEEHVVGKFSWGGVVSWVHACMHEWMMNDISWERKYSDQNGKETLYSEVYINTYKKCQCS